MARIDPDAGRHLLDGRTSFKPGSDDEVFESP